jgi:hypothetical protein
MTRRILERDRRGRPQFDEYVRETAGAVAAAEIEKAKRLHDSGALTEQEFDAMKRRLLPNMVGAAGYRPRAETGALGARSRREVDTRSRPGGGTARQRLGDG